MCLQNTMGHTVHKPFHTLELRIGKREIKKTGSNLELVLVMTILFLKSKTILEKLVH